MRAPRARAELSHDDLVSLLQPHVVSRLWITYTTKMQGRVDRELLTKLSPLLRLIEQPLKQVPLAAALDSILEGRGGFAMTPSQRADWSKTCAQRLRVAHRHWKDGLRRGAAWMEKFQESGNTNTGDAFLDGIEKKKKKGAEKNCFFYGFCKDQWRAWRSAHEGVKVFADDAFVKLAECEDDDFIYGIWGKDEQRITDMTVREFQAASKAKRLFPRSAQRFYEDVMKTGEKIDVRTRKDRPPHPILISLQVNGRQKGSVQADAFPDTESAGRFMAKIAKMVVSQEIRLEDVYAVRDRLLVEEGISVIKRTTAASGGDCAEKAKNEKKKKKKEDKVLDDGDSAGKVEKEKCKYKSAKVLRRPAGCEDGSGTVNRKLQRKKRCVGKVDGEVASMNQAASSAVPCDEEDALEDSRASMPRQILQNRKRKRRCMKFGKLVKKHLLTSPVCASEGALEVLSEVDDEGDHELNETCSSRANHGFGVEFFDTPHEPIVWD